MTNLRNKLNIVTIVFLLSSCSNVKRDSIDYVVYGTYAGECMKHCATMYKLENTRLLVDTTDSFFNNSKKVTFRGDTLSKKDFLRVQVIKRQLPNFLLSSSSKTFGKPDDHDQGGIFIELKSGLTIKRFYIDTQLDRIPNELRDYAKLIMEVARF